MTRDAQLRYSEIFYSVQGEGRYCGVPSIFLRTFGCNFRCDGFGQQRDARVAPEAMPYRTISLDGVTSLAQLPVATIGCDSSASWSPRFKHLCPLAPVTSVASALRECLPLDDWGEIHLVITGGEPLLGWQPALARLLAAPALLGLRHLTFETNGTQPLQEELARCLPPHSITWSVSPKLSLSGESWSEAIRPDVLRSYQTVKGAYLYLKFVVEEERDVAEARRAVREYEDEGILPDAVYLMPQGGTPETYGKQRERVAHWALREGWRYSPRLHVDLFGNRYGT